VYIGAIPFLPLFFSQTNNKAKKWIVPLLPGFLAKDSFGVGLACGFYTAISNG
jgi:hypothetical protein